MTYNPDPWDTPIASVAEPEPDPSTLEGLIALLDLQFKWLVKVSRSEILYKSDGVEETYRARSRQIREALKRYGLADPFPWRTAEDFWDKFCGQWGTYWERKQALRAAYEPVESALLALQENPNKLQSIALAPDAAWAALESRITGLMKEYENADSLDGYQDVARRSREILIDAVNLVYEPSMCPAGEDQPQGANAKRRFELILACKVGGRSNKDLRGWFNATWDLAQSTTHSGSAARAAAFAFGSVRADARADAARPPPRLPAARGHLEPAGRRTTVLTGRHGPPAPRLTTARDPQHERAPGASPYDLRAGACCRGC